MLIIWLQGIWLPLHGYSFEETPLWAGIFMTPLLLGFIVMGPISGYLSDRFGARLFSTTGMLLQVLGFLGLTLLPADFNYPVFAVLLFMLGCGSGLFASPNTSSIMSSVPPETRGASSGMRATFQNSATLVSIGLFFSIVTLGLAAALPATLSTGLITNGVPDSSGYQPSRICRQRLRSLVRFWGTIRLESFSRQRCCTPSHRRTRRYCWARHFSRT